MKLLRRNAKEVSGHGLIKGRNASQDFTGTLAQNPRKPI
jgi:hypothetical protein